MIEELIELIDEMTKELLASNKNRCEELSGIIIPLLMKTLPQIVQTYFKPEFADVSTDAQLWIEQIQRNINAMNGDDVLAIVDSLYFETRENLILYKKMISNMENN